MPSMKNKADDSSDKPQCMGAEQKTPLLHSVAAFLEINGFFKTLKKFLSEAKIEKDALKGSLLDLEELYCKNIIKCKQSNTNLSSQKAQDLQTDVLSQGNEIGNMVAATETAIKKKNKQNDMGNTDTFSEIKNLKETSVDKEGQDFEVKSKEKKKSQKISNSLDKGGEQYEDLKLLEPEEPGKNRKDKKKKKNKPDSVSPPDAIEQNKLNSLPAATETKTTDDKSFIDPEKERKSKDKKKRKDKQADSLADHVDTLGLENKQGDEDMQTDDVTLMSKSKKKKMHKSASESLCKELDSSVADVTGSEINDFKSADADGIDKESKGSKKRKRLVSEEKDSEHADNKSSTEESKRRKVDGLNKSKGSDKQEDDNALVSHDNGVKKNKGESDEVGSIEQNGNIDKSADKSSTQKSMIKQCSGSVEPKTVNAFKRVKVEEVEFSDERLKDNSYWAKDGADTGYGAKAQEVLGQVRGKDFRHEKTKKKRGSYRGGHIDLHSHSVKFNYSDDE